ncbi:MAG: hypothetical protein WDA71_05865 [Actinomycetota bacterium]
MREFFERNAIPVLASYGQVFFALGLAAAVQAWRRESGLVLARRMWLLAIFGFATALASWGDVFIPIQQGHMPSWVITAMRAVQVGIRALSFAVLARFGIELLRPGRHRVVVPAAIVAWLALTGAVFAIVRPHGGSLAEMETLARYGLALPGCLLAGFGLRSEARRLDLMRIPRGPELLLAAGGAFALDAFLEGLLVPEVPLWPASKVSAEAFLRLTGVPAVVVETVLGFGIAVVVIQALSVFRVVTARRVDVLMRERAAGEERERIAAELHEAIVQKLFGVGLEVHGAARRGDTAGLEGVAESLRSIVADVLTHAEEGRREAAIRTPVLGAQPDGGLAADARPAEGLAAEGEPTDS